MKRRRLVVALFVVLVTLSAVAATVALVSSVSLSTGGAVACINSSGELDETGYGTIVMGKPKPGDWT